MMVIFHLPFTVSNKERVVLSDLHTTTKPLNGTFLPPAWTGLCTHYQKSAAALPDPPSQTPDAHSCFPAYTWLMNHVLGHVFAPLAALDYAKLNAKITESLRSLVCCAVGVTAKTHMGFSKATPQSRTEASGGDESRRPFTSQWICGALAGKKNVHVSRPPQPNPHFYLFSSLFGLTGVVSVLSSCFTRRLCSNWLLISV